MRFVEEFRALGNVRRLASAITQATAGPWTVMEVCGGQTHTIARYDLQSLLPSGLELIHGPGCPVCVTPAWMIEHARTLCMKPNTLLCSFGDMIRVPGLCGDLLSARAEGGRVKVVLSPLDAVQLAKEDPHTEVVFFAVGFETTAPTSAAAVVMAKQLGLTNFTLLGAHVRVPPVMAAIAADEQNRIDGFLAAGHVCTVEGVEAYRRLASRYRLPIVATGFEPADILQGLLMCVEQLESNRHEVEVQYSRAVQEGGNTHARELVHRVFEPCDMTWRGLGLVKEGGIVLRDAFGDLDACKRFGLETTGVQETSGCEAGRVLLGQIRPPECALFGSPCTPERPIGAPMVSSEGACAAYWHYQRPKEKAPAWTTTASN